MRNRSTIPKGIMCEKLLRDLARELDIAKVMHKKTICMKIKDFIYRHVVVLQLCLNHLQKVFLQVLLNLYYLWNQSKN